MKKILPQDLIGNFEKVFGFMPQDLIENLEKFLLQDLIRNFEKNLIFRWNYPKFFRFRHVRLLFVFYSYYQPWIN